MTCQQCGGEMKSVRLTAHGYELMAYTGAFKGFKGSAVEGLACPECGHMELRVKNPERLWKPEEKQMKSSEGGQE